jgi:competence protein ComEA
VFDALERYRWAIVGLLALPMVAALAVLVSERLDDPDPLVITTEGAPADIRVYVAGAVERPGVYPVASDARWIDALDAAGGATSDANLEAVNLSRRVQDEDQIVVPRLGDPAVAGSASAPLLVNVNVASESDLEELPGVGEVRADRIIQSRTVDGPFLQIEDLLLRDLLPDSVFQEIAPMITVD